MRIVASGFSGGAELCGRREEVVEFLYFGQSTRDSGVRARGVHVIPFLRRGFVMYIGPKERVWNGAFRGHVNTTCLIDVSSGHRQMFPERYGNIYGLRRAFWECKNTGRFGPVFVKRG